MTLLRKHQVIEEAEPAVVWTPIEALELEGKRGRIQIKGAPFELRFDDCLDLVVALEKVAYIKGCRLLRPERRAAVVNRAALALDKTLAGRPHVTPEIPPDGLEDCFYLGVWTPGEIWHNWIFYLEDAFIALHRMNRVLQGLHPRGTAAAVRAALRSPLTH